MIAAGVRCVARRVADRSAFAGGGLRCLSNTGDPPRESKQETRSNVEENEIQGLMPRLSNGNGDKDYDYTLEGGITKESYGTGENARAWDELPKSWSSVDPAIKPHIRCCRPPEGGLPPVVKDSGFHAYFLGTGSSIAPRRLSSCTMIRVGSEGFLFDAGEGCQRHIQYSSAKMKRISKIFITHLHADHTLGLPGLLLGTNLANLLATGTVVRVYGPPGLYNFIVANLCLTYSTLRIQVEVYELTGGQCRTHWKQRGMLGNFAQFRHENVIRKTIHCDSDGVWDIMDFDEITRDYDSRRHTNLRVRAAEVYHVPNVQTFGYVVEEQKPLPRINSQRTKELGLLDHKKINELKNGFPAMNDDGTREVQPEEVCYESEKKGRKIAILGDTCGVPAPMARLCKGADILVHEATLDEEDRPLSVRRGHSTASMAGHLADSVGAELLVLNHMKVKIAEHDQRRAREARAVINGGTRVLSANDFLEVVLPEEGFKYLENQEAPATEKAAHQDFVARQTDDGDLRWYAHVAPKGSLLPSEEASDLVAEKYTFNFSTPKEKEDQARAKRQPLKVPRVSRKKA